MGTDTRNGGSVRGEDDPAGLGDRLRELLQYFHPAAAAEYSSDELATVAGELLSGAAVQTWVSDQMAQMKIRSMDFRNGVSMELEAAQDMAAAWVASARALLMDAENYSETVYAAPEDAPVSYSMGVSIPELPERYTLTVQRVAPGRLTPHEARIRGEEAIARVWQWIADVNDGAGYDTGDLGFALEKSGFPAPPDEEGKETG